MVTFESVWSCLSKKENNHSAILQVGGEKRNPARTLNRRESAGGPEERGEFLDYNNTMIRSSAQKLSACYQLIKR